MCVRYSHYLPFCSWVMVLNNGPSYEVFEQHVMMSQWSWPLHLGYKMSPLHPFYPSRNLLSQLVYEFLSYGQEMCFVRSKWKSLPTISLGLSPSGGLKKLPQGVLSSWEWDGRLSPWQSSAWQHKEVFKKEKKITDTNCAIQLLLGKKGIFFTVACEDRKFKPQLHSHSGINEEGSGSVIALKWLYCSQGKMFRIQKGWCWLRSTP